MIGTLLAQGPRTVAAALRAIGRSGERRFERSYRVLNRVRWSGLRGAQILLRLLLALLPSSLPIVMVVDETLEQQFGPRIRAKGGVSGCGALESWQSSASGATWPSPAPRQSAWSCSR
ncbi:MAG: transposase [Lamprobacter sp.]|nr:transposase [Lamprobacter sp.]